jgi:hypothetical protein
MPEAFPVPQRADRPAGLDHVRNDEHLGKAFDEGTAMSGYGREVQRAEAAAERDHLRIGQVLVAKQQDMMFEPGSINRGEHVIAQRPAEVDALDFRGDFIRKRTNAHAITFSTGRFQCLGHRNALIIPAQRSRSWIVNRWYRRAMSRRELSL